MEHPSSPTEQQSRVPNLAIWHVLLWMGGVSVVAALHEQGSWSGSGSSLMRLQQLAAALTYYLLAGLTLAGLLLAIGCAVRKRRYYPVAGGHWLLTASGMIFVVSEASNSIADAWHRSHPEMNHIDGARQVMVFSFALSALVYLSCAVLVRERWTWRFVFVGYAAPCLLWSIVQAIESFGDPAVGYRLSRIAFAIQWPWQWGLAIVTLSLAVIERCLGRRGDWLHWTGITYVIAWVSSQSLLQFVHAWIGAV